MEAPILLAGLLTASGLITPGIQFFTRGREEGRIAGYIAITALSASILLILYTASTLPTKAISQAGLFATDLLGSFFAITVLLVTLLVAVSSIEYVKAQPNSGVYYSLLLFTGLGMTLLAFSTDLLMIAIAWELMSIPTYVLAGFAKKDPQSNEAAIKYFLVGAFSTAIILYAISLAYALTGSTNLYTIVQELAPLSLQLEPLVLLTIALLITGLGFKMAIVPFHMWIPDAYEGAPTTISTLLAAGTKKAGFVAAIRILMVALPAFRADWSMTIAFLALLTMTLGNIAALTQKSITRLLAYSSIAQAGFILIGLAAPSQLGLTGALFHVLNHAVMKGAAFIAAALILYQTSRTDLNMFNGLGRRMPVAASTMTIALLGLAGVPPLSGFWSKLLLFTAALEANLGWLAVAGVLNSAFSLGYYAWIIKRMYMDVGESSEPIREPIPFELSLAVATALTILFGLYPGPIIDFARRAVVGL